MTNQYDRRWPDRGILGNQQVAPIRTPVRPPTQRPAIVTAEEIQRAPSRVRPDGSVAQQGFMPGDRTYPQARTEGPSVIQRGLGFIENNVAQPLLDATGINRFTRSIGRGVNQAVADVSGLLSQPDVQRRIIETGLASGTAPSAQPTNRGAYNPTKLAGSDNTGPQAQRDYGFTEINPARKNTYGSGPGIRTVRDERTGRIIHTNVDDAGLAAGRGQSDFIQAEGGPRIESAGFGAALDRQQAFRNEGLLHDRKTNFYQRQNTGRVALGSGGITDEGVEYARGSRLDPRGQDIGSQQWRPMTTAIAENRRNARAAGDQQYFDNQLAKDKLQVAQTNASAALKNAQGGNNWSGVEVTSPKPELGLDGTPTGTTSAGQIKLPNGTTLPISNMDEMDKIQGASAILYQLLLEQNPGAEREALMSEAYEQAYEQLLYKRSQPAQ